MPNHIKNVWRIKNIPQDKVAYLVNKLTTEYKPVGTESKEKIIDFDLIIPEPRLIKDCPSDCRVNKDSHVMEDKDRPWFDWYAWHLRYWDTKWNAYDGYTKVGKTQITFVFSTAWSFAARVADKLSELGYDLELKYADEDYGCNCGKLIYDSKTKEWDITSEHDLPDSEKFARYLWNNY